MTTAAAAGPPPPTTDVDSAPYWQGLREHRLRLQACTGCGRRRFPPTPACPYCAHPSSTWEEASGVGTVYSAITVHRSFDAAFAADVPYRIATVDLDGGGRIVARAAAEVAIDDRVGPQFHDHAEWTEMRFVPLA